MAKAALPPATHQFVTRVLREAAAKGVDPVLALHHQGLLRFQGVELQMTIDFLFETADTLNDMTCQQLAGPGQRAPQTALDTKRAVVAWLQGWGNRIKEGMK